MAQRCYAPDNSREYDPIKAVFEDDVEVDIAQFTCGDWALLHQHRAGATGGQAIIHEVYFDKEHVTNRNRIWVTSKTDRHPLMVINENAQQVLQIGIFSFMPLRQDRHPQRDQGGVHSRRTLHGVYRPEVPGRPH